MRVDWFLCIDHTRRIDYAIMYLCKHIIYVIYAYLVLSPKNISKDLKVFIFILSLVDLFHYFLTSHIGFEEIKLLLVAIIYVIYKIIKR